MQNSDRRGKRVKRYGYPREGPGDGEITKMVNLFRVRGLNNGAENALRVLNFIG